MRLIPIISGKERQSVTRVTAQRYKKGRKKDRSGILDNQSGLILSCPLILMIS
jgi:hypothetical protein